MAMREFRRLIDCSFKLANLWARTGYVKCFRGEG